MKPNELEGLLQIAPFPYPPNFMKSLQQYYQFLIEENVKYNLTAITNEEDVYEKHFYDSLSILFHTPLTNETVCDIGAGAGFPGMVLKIACPGITYYPLDATAKKMNFIQMLSNRLQLQGVIPLVARAEEYKGSPFDVVVARGVANLPILLELGVNLVTKGGVLIAMKGSRYEEELKASTKAIEILGYELEHIQPYVLPQSGEQRVNLIFRKKKPHAAIYPRSYAKIKQRSL